MGHSLALSVLEHFPSIALDIVMPRISPFHTSYLTCFLGNNWLSDDHINAGADLINWHPDHLPHIHVLSTFFVESLQARFKRQPTWIPRHPQALETHIASGSVTELFIPLHSPSHWSVIHINITNKTYSHCDTLALDEFLLPETQIQPLSRWLSYILGANIILAPVRHTFRVGAQSDSDSCGVAVLTTIASCVLRSAPLPWSQLTSKEHRIDWVLQFLALVGSPSNAFVEDVFEDPPQSDHNTVDSMHPLDISGYAADCSIDLSCDVISIDSSSDSDLEFMDLDSDADSFVDLGNKSTSPVPSAPATSPSKPSLVQSKLPFKSISCSDWLTQETQRYHEGQAEREAQRDRLELKHARAKIEQRKYERLRKRAQRKRQEQTRLAAGLLNPRSSQVCALFIPLNVI